MFIDTFIRHLRSERNYSLHTLRAYEGDLRAFQEYLSGVEDSISLLDADVDLLRSWVASLMDNGGAASSVCRKLSSLRSFYAFMRAEGNAVDNPALAVHGPKGRKVLPTFLKEEEINRLIDETSFGKDFIACRDRAIILCFYATGPSSGSSSRMSSVLMPTKLRTLRVAFARIMQNAKNTPTIAAQTLVSQEVPIFSVTWST